MMIMLILIFFNINNLKYKLIKDNLNFKQIKFYENFKSFYRKYSIIPNRFKNIFKIKIDINSNNNFIELGIDTGSHLLWFFENACINCDNIVEKIIYRYLDGDIKGKIILKDIKFGSKISKNHYIMIVKNNNLNNIIPLLGLSIHNKNFKYSTFLETLYKNKLIDSIEFSINIDQRNDYKNSFIKFGSLNDNNFNLITNSQIISTNFYMIKINNFRLNNFKIINNISAIIDSGNTLLAFPYELSIKILLFLKKLKINCELNDEYNYRFKYLTCNYSKNFPDLIFNINDKKIFLESKYWIDECNITINYCLTKIEFHYIDKNIILGLPIFNKYLINFSFKEIKFFEK